MEHELRFVWEQYGGYLPHLGLAFIVWGAIVVVSQIFYNLYLHPLRKFPGPLAARATRLWRARKILKGDLPQTVRALHEKYGPVVRIGPDELSFVESQAWKDIYGHHGSNEMAKDPKFYRLMGKHVPDTIISADRERHGLLRRQLAHGFSERSMREQEPIIGEYVDLLMRRLEEHCEDGRKPLDMRAWFNFTTFDVIGNLGFGSDFGCLEKSRYHPWVGAILHNLKDNALMRVVTQFLPPLFPHLLNQMGMLKGRKQHMEYTRQTVRKRMALKTERPDFIEGLLKKKDDLTEEEINVNASVLIIAGSETTATLLSGAVYLLGTHRDVLEKLTREVRSAFTSEDQITLTSVNSLTYMLACLNESFRQYPPAALGLPRVVPKGGSKIAGHWVPQDTRVAVWQLAANYSERNFSKPEEFHPERFLGDERFATDDLSAMQPFSVGPRNCIGRNLAYAEMRLILARILYRFDIELAPGAQDWMKNQRFYSLWDKPELPVYLKPARTS
uniref:Cytochrome P450 monooxygenase n=1 Tax=Nodulisporium sp. TaxID=1897413 RepID=A0A2R4QF10_9PEZI|nr:cytochrome P450 monooxygenase [Nodulisporium sp.]